LLIILPVPKQNRVTEIAIENNLPIVALVQSVWNDLSCDQNSFTDTPYFRQAFFFLVSLKSSMQGRKSSATWRDEVNSDNNLARLCLVHRLRVVRIIQHCPTTVSLSRTMRKSS
jgi:hypothetical protein